MSQEFSKEQLENMVANLQANQQGLLNENNQLRGALEDAKKKKDGPLIYSKMLAVKNDIGSVGKDQKNSGQGWKFRGIDQFVNALHPILNKHGVGITTKVIQSAEAKFIKNEKTGKTSKNTQIIMEYTFFAEDGSSITSSMPAEGVDPGDKGINKALSAAFKYALIQTFCVPTEDMAEADLENATVDGDETPRKKSKASKKAAPKKSSASKRFKKKVDTSSEEEEEDEL